MGGGSDAFQSTCWTEIRGFTQQDEWGRKLLLDQLIGRYGRPVYCYLRRKGLHNEAAKDLTQDFFHDIVLGRDLITKADQARGGQLLEPASGKGSEAYGTYREFFSPTTLSHRLCSRS